MSRSYTTATRTRATALLAALVTALATAGCAAPGTPATTTAPAADPTASPAPSVAVGTAAAPGALLDLRNWYLTLPTGDAGDPDTVQQPQLATFTGPWFHLDDARRGVVFTADAGGVTTANSTYPRSELREMNGTAKASWSDETGVHTLAVRQAVTMLPPHKPHVVTAQIHDTKSDVIEIRVEDTRLIARWADGRKSFVIDPAYVLGTPYDLRIVASNGRIEVFYDGRDAGGADVSGSGWYFKTGSYLQSNTARGDAPDAVGQVVLYALQVTHSP